MTAGRLDDIAVVIVGNFTDTRSHGYWKKEIRKPRDHTTAELQCLLDITGFMSGVFHEVRDASTPALAAACSTRAALRERRTSLISSSSRRG